MGSRVIPQVDSLDGHHVRGGDFEQRSKFIVMNPVIKTVCLTFGGARRPGLSLVVDLRYITKKMLQKCLPYITVCQGTRGV